MTTDYRDLITRMAKELDDYRQLLLDDRTVTHRLSNEARAALADEPAVLDGREPTSVADGEVAELVAWLREQLHVCLQAPWTPGIKHFGRAAELLERLSPPQPLANGEVGKPVAWMCPAEPYFDGNKWHDQWQVTLDQRLAEYWARPGKPTPLFTRADELLQRQVPVPVSERLPGPEDCDAEGRCWFGTPGCDVWGASWVLRKRSHQRNGITSWLPAHAMPLPEVNNG